MMMMDTEEEFLVECVTEEEKKGRKIA